MCSTVDGVQNDRGIPLVLWIIYCRDKQNPSLFSFFFLKTPLKYRGIPMILKKVSFHIPVTNPFQEYTACNWGFSESFFTGGGSIEKRPLACC